MWGEAAGKGLGAEKLTHTFTEQETERGRPRATTEARGDVGTEGLFAPQAAEGQGNEARDEPGLEGKVTVDQAM